MENNLKYRKLTIQEAGWTEDEFNNFLIDMWRVINKEINAEPAMYEIFDALTGKVVLSPEPATITITLKEGTYNG